MRKLNAIYFIIAAVLFVLSIAITKLPAYRAIGSQDDETTEQALEISESIEELEGVLRETESSLKNSNINTEVIIQSESIEETTEFETLENETETELTEEEESIKEYLENTDFEELIDFNASKPYKISVNRAANCVTVYGLDFDGEYSIPYKTMTCSTGLYKENTPLGTYYISDKYDWRMMIDGSFAQYAVRFNGGVMFHSIPYYSMNKGDMEWQEYNKLGEAASLGCVRLQVVDVKWIFDNCPIGTEVYVYDDEENPGPLGKNSCEKLDENSVFRGWDPTDPDENNPWNNIK